MISHDERIPDALPAYLADECSPPEAAAVEAWVAADPRRARLISQLEESRRALRETRPQLDSNDMADAVLSRVAALEPTRAPMPLARRPLSAAFLGAAALLLAGFAALFLRSASDANAVARYTTAPGQQASVQLADGSHMMLAPATVVTVSPQGVAVTGEAYFTIRPRSSRPFVVRTENAVVEVLGTKFTVRHYPGESASRVVVEDGKVSLRPLRRLSRTGPPTVLAARMLAQVTDSGVTVRSGITTRDYTAWTEGSLVFKGVALRDVLVELGRAYGTTIRVEDTVLAKQPLVLDVSVQRHPLTQVLDLIGLTVDAHYTRDGQTYLVSPGPKSTRMQQRQRFPQLEKRYGL